MCIQNPVRIGDFGQPLCGNRPSVSCRRSGQRPTNREHDRVGLCRGAALGTGQFFRSSLLTAS